MEAVTVVEVKKSFISVMRASCLLCKAVTRFFWRDLLNQLAFVMSSQLPSGVLLSQIPAGKPPAGVTPRFDSPSSLTSALVGLCVFLILWGTVFAAIRIYSNRAGLKAGDSELVQQFNILQAIDRFESLRGRGGDPFGSLLLHPSFE